MLVVGWSDEVRFLYSQVVAAWGAPRWRLGFGSSGWDLSMVPLRICRVEVYITPFPALVQNLVRGIWPKFLQGRVLNIVISMICKFPQRWLNHRWGRSVSLCDGLDPTYSRHLCRQLRLPGCRIAYHLSFLLDIYQFLPGFGIVLRTWWRRHIFDERSSLCIILGARIMRMIWHRRPVLMELKGDGKVLLDRQLALGWIGIWCSTSTLWGFIHLWGKSKEIPEYFYTWLPLGRFDFDAPLGMPQFWCHFIGSIYGPPPVLSFFQSMFRTWMGGGPHPAEILAGLG